VQTQEPQLEVEPRHDQIHQELLQDQDPTRVPTRDLRLEQQHDEQQHNPQQDGLLRLGQLDPLRARDLRLEQQHDEQQQHNPQQDGLLRLGQLDPRHVPAHLQEHEQQQEVAVLDAVAAAVRQDDDEIRTQLIMLIAASTS